MKKLALSLKRHWPNIKTYFSHRISNANAEQINSVIQRVKAQAKGFRNSERFRMVILFHCGELDVYPATVGYLASSTYRQNAFASFI